MAFEGLSDKLGAAFKKLKNKGKLSEKDVRDAMREVRLALLEADVNYKVAKDFTNTVTERAVGSDVMESLTPAQMVVKIVREELTALMGGENERIKTAQKPPTVIMLCGLQGSGKTTHAGKLAKMLKKGANVILLDEPTNDLDVDTLRSLEEGIMSYPGCVFVTSHDRWFLDRLATHILAYEGDSQVVWFEGNFEEYEKDKRRRLGEDAVNPHRVKYKPLVR